MLDKNKIVVAKRALVLIGYVLFCIPVLYYFLVYAQGG